MTDASSRGPLAGIKVVDFGQYVAGPLLGRLLADAGAEVVRIERPGGPSLRDPGNAFLLGNRIETIVLDLKQACEQEQCWRYVEAADVVLENFRPGVMARLGIDLAEARRRNDALITCSLPGFAEDDRRGNWAGWEGVVMAEGSAYWRPTETSLFFDGVVTDLPPFSSLPIASVFAAGLAALAISGALVARHRDGGLGQHVEVPLSDALLEASGIASTTVERPEPMRPVLAMGAGIYHGSDGGTLCYAGVVYRHLVALAGSAGHDDWIDSGWIDYDRLMTDPQRAADLRTALVALFARRPAGEWEAIMRPAGIPIGMVRSTRSFLRDPAAGLSGMVEDIRDPAWGDVRTLSRAVGFEVRPASAPIAPVFEKDAPPLSGFKVIDTSRIVAAPTAARLLADMGAEVVKVDRDPELAFSSSDEPTFHVYVNRGKTGLVLDLKDPVQRKRFDELLQDSDALIANAIPSRLNAVGLGEDDVRAIAPNIVFSYLNSYGTRGPWADYRGYAEIANAVTGLAHLTSGWHAKPSGALPSNFPAWPYTDSMTGILSAFGTVAALFDRQRGGATYRVETSLVQATLLEQMPFAVDANSVDPYRGRDISTPTYRLYDTADGQVFVAIASDDIPEALKRLDGREASVIDSALAEAIGGLSTETVCERLNFGRSGAGKLRPLAETMSPEGPWAARGLRLERQSDDYGVVVTQAPVMRLTRTPLMAGPTPRFFRAASL